MKIVLTGGGSGGHIVPLLAVAHELKRRDPKIQIIYIGQKGDGLADLPSQDPNIDTVYFVSAGKFRRYHGEGIKQLFDVKTIALNIRDAFRVLMGLFQSWRIMGKEKPAVICTRGGFVSVPVALGGKLRKIPYITHDSDSTPSLANRIIARWAAWHAVALPEHLYPYPPQKTIRTGVPVNNAYKPVSATQRQAFIRSLDLGIHSNDLVLLVTGGGNGARGLNMSVVNSASYMLSQLPNLHIIHLTGRSLEDETLQAYDKSLKPQQRTQVHVFGFVKDLYNYSAASDLIIARGGASGLAEFAMQEKACLIIPPSQLVWQIKHARALAEEGAIVQLSSEQAAQELRLANEALTILKNESMRKQLGARLSDFAYPDAAERIADLVLKTGKPHEQ